MDEIVGQIQDFLAHPYTGDQMDVVEWAAFTALIVTVAVMWHQFVLKYIVD